MKYTTVEQSKTLLDLGLQPESADMCWGIDAETLRYNNTPYPLPWKDYTAKEYYMPCWSTEALIELIPKTLVGSLTFQIFHNAAQHTYTVGHQMIWKEKKTFLYWHKEESLFDAAYKHLVWCYDKCCLKDGKWIWKE